MAGPDGWMESCCVHGEAQAEICVRVPPPGRVVVVLPSGRWYVVDETVLKRGWLPPAK